MRYVGGDKATRKINPKKTAKGYLPQLYFTFSNTDYLGTKFKCITCSKTGVIFHRVTIGEEGYEDQNKIGATSFITKFMNEEKMGWTI